MSMTAVLIAVPESQAQSLKDDMDAIDELLDDEESDAFLDLGKAWNALHFLLSGTSLEPTPGFGGAILGGDEIGEDLGYGPARLISVAQVRLIAKEFANTHISSILARYDAAKMESLDLYPGGWDDDTWKPELRTALGALVKFYRSADGKAVLAAIL